MLFSAVKSICRRGNRVNEDNAHASDNFAFVIDGASGLYDIKITDGDSDAQWLSHNCAKILARTLSNIQVPLKQIVLDAAKELLKYYEQFLNGAVIEEKTLASQSISIFRLNGSRLEYFSLGDCTGIIEFNNGQLEVLHEGAISRLDERVVATALEISKAQGISVKQAMAQCRDILKANRDLKNKEGGYYTMDVTANGIEKATYLSFDAQEISSIALLSDGFAELVTSFKVYNSYQELYLDLKNKALCDVLQPLIDRADSDAELNIYPRLKKIDDASAIFALVE